MRRYRRVDANAAALVAQSGTEPIEPLALFGRRAPLRLEIGFGHGRFLSHMAASHPGCDFLGVEAKSLRVNKTAHKSTLLGAANIRLFAEEAHQFVRFRLPSACLERCYVLFSDPWPRARHRRRRLINRSFLIDVAHALEPGGRLIIATDAHDYGMMALSHSSTMPGTWHNCYAPAGYRFDIPTRFPTVFEQHRKSEGHRICHLLFERSPESPPPRAPWRTVHLGQGFGQQHGAP
ncbi:MAG: tRNA (guanosine(46)-N7)-methyltransferase TrmB [Planctomycetota bacterium]